MSDGQLTRREREDLAALMRRQEKVGKTRAKQRKEELLADAAAKLAAVYDADNALWAPIVAEAIAAVEKANERIFAAGKELGIPKRFRPSLHHYWNDRGENASKERRAELWRLATKHAQAKYDAAVAELERASVEYQTRLMAGSLESDAARAALAAMPTADDLMPMLSPEEIGASIPLAQLGGEDA